MRFAESDGFAGAIVRLLEEEPLRRRLAEAGFRRVSADYDLGAVARSLDEAIHAVCEHKPAPGGPVRW